MEITLGANDDEGEPAADAQFEATVERPDGSSELIRVIGEGAQRTASFADTSQPGDYRVTVTAMSGGESLGEATARFSVSDQDIELDQPAAEPSLLASLARQTANAGGAGLAPEELPSVLEQLSKQANEFEEEVLRKVTLWDTWPMLLAFVGVLSIEWFLRKRWGMA